MRELLLLICCIFWFVETKGQTLEEKQNLFKYWNYRDMLTRKFLNVPQHSPQYYQNLGDPDFVNERYLRGKSMPLDCYQYFNWCKKEWEHPNTNWIFNETTDICPNEYMSKGGDGTTHLGWYIAVLATEWKLLNLKGLPTQKTEEELYWAIRAVQRLDEYAEAYMKAGAQEFDHEDLLINKRFDLKERNGLFMRSDYFSWWLPNESLTAVDKIKDERDGTEIKVYKEDYNGAWAIGGNNKGKANYMSQDQIFHIFMGFLLVKHLIPDWVTPYGESLTSMATQNTQIIMDYLNIRNYRIRVPLTVPEEDVNLGAEITAFREPLTLIGERITGIPYGQTERLRQIGDVRLAAFSLAWWNLQYHMLFRLTEDIQYQSMLLAAMSNSWKRIYEPPLLPNQIISRIISKIFGKTIEISINPNTTQESLAILASHNINRKYIYSYLYHVLNTNIVIPNYFETHFVFSNMNDALNDAPCEGPSYKFRTEPLLLDQLPPNDSHYRDDYLRTAKSGWRNSHRWVHTESGINGKDDFTGQYHGLDYMLAYNLWLLMNGGNFHAPDFYENQLDYNLTNLSFPLPNGQGSTQNPKKIIGINSVVINNVNFENDSKVEIFSADEIKLNGNISSQGNLDVHLKITDELTDVCQTIYPNLLVVPNPNNNHIDDSTAYEAFQADFPDSLRSLREITAFIQDSLLCLTDLEYDSLILGNASERIISKIDSCIQLYDSTYLGQNTPRMEALRKQERPTEITLYPNPTDDGLTISFYLSAEKQITIELYNPTGNSLNQFTRQKTFSTGTQEINLDLSGLASGFYLCKITLDGNEQRLIKVIKK